MEPVVFKEQFAPFKTVLFTGNPLQSLLQHSVDRSCTLSCIPDGHKQRRRRRARHSFNKATVMPHTALHHSARHVHHDRLELRDSFVDMGISFSGAVLFRNLSAEVFIHPVQLRRNLARKRLIFPSAGHGVLWTETDVSYSGEK